MMNLEMMARLAESSADEVSDLLQSRQGDLTRSYKDTHDGQIDFATQTDIDAERIIRARLAVSGIPVHGEEEFGADPLDGWCWVVDPIDGTLNWANNLPFFCVSIALCENGVPRVGVIETPQLHFKTYIGIEGGGAWRDGEPIKVTDAPAEESVVAYDGFRSGSQDSYLERLRPVIGRHRLFGTTAMEMALCAAGGFSAVISPVAKFWDVAAGIAIIRAAGGVAHDPSGGEHRPGSGSVIAGAAQVVGPIISALNTVSNTPRSEQAGQIVSPGEKPDSFDPSIYFAN